MGILYQIILTNYLKTKNGWLYLCVWIDLYSRKVVGWSISPSLATKFVCNALLAALNSRPGARPLIHTDRGVQYASKEFRRLLWANKLRQSMSRKGDCWDNAVSESFFATLEKELLALQPLQNRRDTREQVASYIESYYNLVRLHSHLDYVSPIEFETNAPS